MKNPTWVAMSFAFLPFTFLMQAPVVHAEDVGAFYRGKTITLVISGGEGDSNDQTARLVARYWSNYIPGKPNIIVRNMPGAGSLLAANYIYNDAPEDGTVVGTFIPAFVTQQVLGGTGVNFSADKFGWIGSTNTSNSTIYVWHGTNVTTLQQAMSRRLLLGGTGAGSNSAHYPMIANDILGTQFKLVMGYRTASDVVLAMERGEVQGRAGETFNTLTSVNADLMRDKKLNILVQIGDVRQKGFETIPLLTDFAKEATDRAALQLFSDEVSLGRPYLLPPGVPEQRATALHDSFESVMKDPALLADARKMNLDISPTDGDRLRAIAIRMINVKGKVLDRVRAALGSSASKKTLNN
jgi:tripartite-type tricarboxylate transporter receptor subunit TctC